MMPTVAGPTGPAGAVGTAGASLATTAACAGVGGAGGPWNARGCAASRVRAVAPAAVAVAASSARRVVVFAAAVMGMVGLPWRLPQATDGRVLPHAGGR